MSKRKALKIEIELILPADRKTEDVLKQLQDFLLDEIPIEDYDLEWEPFDCGAITIALLEDHPNAYIENEQEEDTPPPLVRRLDEGEA